MADNENPPQVEDLIRYDVLAQEALREVVKKVLKEVSKSGLPGEHHFYISFDTNFPGVRISTRMKEKYPEEMTIVIQHQFWDLSVNDNNFEIGLSFNDVAENLLVPYAAIKGFFDPSVQFGLQFDTPVDDHQSAEDKSVEGEVVQIGKELIASDNSGRKPDAAEADKEEAAEDKDDDDASADVVSLDAFRKKP